MHFSDTTSKILRSLLSYTIIYIALISTLGYIFGSGDLIEIEPYWDAFFHPEKWANDFFVSHQLDRVPNERYLFVWLLSLTGPPNAYVALTVHYLTTLLLLHGMRKLASIWIKSPFWQVLALFAMALGLYGINTGGNELYYPLFTNSYLAQATGIWAIYFMIRENRWAMTLMLIATALIHILIGVQLLVLTMLPLTIRALLNNKIRDFIKAWALPKLLWISTAGVFFILLFAQVRQGDIPSELQFEIMEFRLAHHFFPAYFPLRSWIIIGLITIPAFLFFLKKDKLVMWFFISTTAGAVIYSIGIYLFKSGLVLSSQWFESTIWMEYFSVIGIVAIIDRNKSRLDLNTGLLGTSLICSVILLLLTFSPLPIFNSRIFSEPLGNGAQYEEEISRKVSSLGLEDALFALPPELTAFKWYAQEASYIDYKAMIHHKEVMAEWYERVKFLYGVDVKDRRAGVNIYEKANAHLQEMLNEFPSALKEKGISHMILPVEYKGREQPILQNEKYAVYLVE